MWRKLRRLQRPITQHETNYIFWMTVDSNTFSHLDSNIKINIITSSSIYNEWLHFYSRNYFSFSHIITAYIINTEQKKYQLWQGLITFPTDIEKMRNYGSRIKWNCTLAHRHTNVRFTIAARNARLTNTIICMSSQLFSS